MEASTIFHLNHLLWCHRGTLPQSFSTRHRTPLWTPALETTHLGYVRRPADRKRTGLAEDFREDLSQGQAEETGQLPTTSDPHSVLSDQTHPCSKYNARPKRSDLETVHISEHKMKTMETVMGAKLFKRWIHKMQSFYYKNIAMYSARNKLI